MQNKQTKSIISAIILAFSVMIAGVAAAKASPPTIDKTTIIIRANTTFISDSNIDGGVAKYGWLPQLDFRVNGPVPSGSQLSFEMTTPDGKSWVSFDCETSAVKEGESLKVEHCGRDLPHEKFTGVLGVYGLKINLKNELQGTGQTLFNGKFKVGKAFNGAVPQDKDNYKWYVDYDWALPIAEVYSRELVDYVGDVEEASPLVATFWFRGDPGSSEVVAYLFRNGAEISNTQDSSKGTSNGEQGVTLFERTPFSWTKKQFTFFNALVYNRTNPNAFPDAFRLDKNPGEYEIKVLRKGKLVRAAKFSVGSDGKIADNGISRQNELGTRRTTVFAVVTGDEDGRQPDMQAWKTNAFFGSPLKGFGQ